MASEMNKRMAHHTQNPYEARFGYSRSVRRGPFIFVSGTTSVSTSPPHNILYTDSAYQQAIVAFVEAISAVKALGGSEHDIARVRIFVKHTEDSSEVGRAMADTFSGGVDFAATMISGVQFVQDEMKVEVELDAVLGY